MAAKSTDFHAPVSRERLNEFISGVYGQNRKSNNTAVKKALKAVLFGVAAEAYMAHRRGAKN